MIKRYIPFLLLLTQITLSYELNLSPDTIPYKTKCSQIKNKKMKIVQDLRKEKIDIDSVGILFEELLINEVIPYWYGVGWTFEGHTNSPDSGTIACGYFISTTLKHLGLNLNRYRLAQQSAFNEVKSLAGDSNLIQKFTYNDSLSDTLIKNLKSGLYMVGQDSHVGYLLRHKENLYFIHSSYIEPGMVVIEEAKNSTVFSMSENYYITPISRNKKLMEKWVKESKVTIITK